jgi:hypothetical protein
LALQGEVRSKRGCCDGAILWISYVSGVMGVCVEEKYMFSGVLIVGVGIRRKHNTESGLIGSLINLGRVLS